jgi:hypothetical protein
LRRLGVAPSAWQACVDCGRGVGALCYADTWRDAFGALTGVLEFTHTARARAFLRRFDGLTLSPARIGR